MSIVNKFDEMSEVYDSQRRLLIPCFDEFYGLAIDMINFEGDNPKVLDLGAGTGIFSKFLLDKFPNANLTLIDLAENMLNMAKKRFKNYNSTNYIVDDYITHDFGNNNEKGFDIIISSLSIHHLSEMDKKEVYKKYINLLNDGGYFINADHVKSSSNLIEDNYLKIIDNFMVNNLSEEECNSTRERRQYDDPSSLNIQLNWMERFGLKDVDVIFKYANYAVLFAKKE